MVVPEEGRCIRKLLFIEFHLYVMSPIIKGLHPFKTSLMISILLGDIY